MSYSFQITSFDEYKTAYKKSVDDPEGFWGDVAASFYGERNGIRCWNGISKNQNRMVHQGGKLNITENCIDRHLETLGDKPAIIWEPNNPEERSPRTYLYSVCIIKFASLHNVLKNNGVKKGDRVCIYMGMVPELAYAVLGCARIGAIHCVIFGGFSCAKYCRPAGGCAVQNLLLPAMEHFVAIKIFL